MWERMIGQDVFLLTLAIQYTSMKAVLAVYRGADDLSIQMQ